MSFGDFFAVGTLAPKKKRTHHILMAPFYLLGSLLLLAFQIGLIVLIVWIAIHLL